MSNGYGNKNHPLLAYAIGAVFMTLSALVAAGVAYHLTLSHHGPGLLRPLLKHLAQESVSPILSEAQRQAKALRQSHFHNIVALPRTTEENRPLCFICHSEMPHNKNKKVRSLLNMHTQYMVCESCHVKEPEKGRLTFKWAAADNPNPKGPFMGTAYEGKTGFLKTVADHRSKITPFYVTIRDGATSAVMNRDAPEARDFMRVRDQLTPAQREGVKNRFHQNLRPKGSDCQHCHREKGALDFEKLGFSAKRIADLVHLNIKGMLTKYEVFYLPDLLTETPDGNQTVYPEDSQP